MTTSKQRAGKEVQRPDSEVESVEDVTAATALVLEDHAPTGRAISTVARAMGYEVVNACSIAEARQGLGELLPELVLIDLGLPDGDGVDVIQELHARGVQDFIVISGTREQGRVVDSLRAGAREFLTKPVRLSDIERAFRRVTDARYARLRGASLPARTPAVEAAELGGDLPSISQLRKSIEGFARPRDIRALIEGPPGAGKRELAAAIHRISEAAGALVLVRCSEQDDDAVHRRFFGPMDERSSFPGYIAQAAGGTLILDDLSRLPVGVQSVLVTELDKGSFDRIGDSVKGKKNSASKSKASGSFTRPGSAKSQPGQEAADGGCSIVGVLREPAESAIEQGRLSRELYYALSRNVVQAPPIRERVSNLGDVAGHMVDEFNALTGGDKALSEQSVGLINRYAWPGNIVEFRSALQAAYACTEVGEEIEFDASVTPELVPDISNDAGYLIGRTFREVERSLMLATLEHNQNNKSDTADMLGISLKTLYNRLREHAGSKSALNPV